MPSDGLDHSGSNDTLGRNETPLERCDLRRGRLADLAGKPSAPTPPDRSPKPPPGGDVKGFRLWRPEPS